MFGKLLKYEFKSAGKWYLGLYGIIAILSVVLGLWIQTLILRSREDISNFNNSATMDTEGWLFMLTIIIFTLIIGGLMISTLLLILRRFYKNIYSRQGYLTMTLPVTSHQILLSKLVAAIIWQVLALLMVFVSFAIIIGLATIPVWHEMDWSAPFSELGRVADFGTILRVLGYASVSTVTSILLMYFAISLGQLFRDHRILLAVVFYFGMTTVLGIIESMINVSLLSNMEDLSNPLDFFAVYPIMTVIDILLAIGFYFGTHYIMTKKINLQ